MKGAAVRVPQGGTRLSVAAAISFFRLPWQQFGSSFCLQSSCVGRQKTVEPAVTTGPRRGLSRTQTSFSQPADLVTRLEAGLLSFGRDIALVSAYTHMPRNVGKPNWILGNLLFLHTVARSRAISARRLVPAGVSRKTPFPRVQFDSLILQHVRS